MSKWTQAEAIQLCVIIEAICPKEGYHVALTGGTLYSTGKRKDCDILFYSIRQIEEANPEKLIDKLTDSIDGLAFIAWFGWMCKLKYKGREIDVFFPETEKSDQDGISGE